MPRDHNAVDKDHYAHNFTNTVSVTMKNNKGKPAEPTIETSSGESRRDPQMYKPASIWMHLRYGVGSIVVMVGPLLIPGLTVKDWIIEFFGGVIGIYVILCLLGAWQSLKGDRRSQERVRSQATVDKL